MRRVVVVLAVLAVAIALSPAYAALASQQTVRLAAPQNAAATCADAKFLTEVGTDFTDFGKAFQKVDVNKPDALAKLSVDVAKLRQKYEDMTVSSDCLAVQIGIVVVISNAGDILTFGLAASVDKANAADYVKLITDQTKRFQTHVDDLTKMISGK